MSTKQVNARRMRASINDESIVDDNGNPIDFDEVLEFLVELAKDENRPADARAKAKEMLESMAKKAGLKGMAAADALSKLERTDSLRARMGLPSLFASKRVATRKGVHQIFDASPEQVRRATASKGHR